MGERVVASRLAGVLVSRTQRVVAPVMDLALEGVGGMRPSTDGILPWAGRFGGGMWIGGRITLTTRRLHFAADALNRMLHSGPTEVDLDLREFLGTSVQGGLLPTVVVVLPGAELWIRCLGARRLADEIDQAVRDAHSGR